MTNIQWQRVSQGQWKAAGTKVSKHVPIPGLASLDLPEDIQNQIKSYLPKPSHPLAIKCIREFQLKMALEDLDWDVQPQVYKIFWVNDFMREFDKPNRQINLERLEWVKPWINPYNRGIPVGLYIGDIHWDDTYHADIYQ